MEWPVCAASLSCPICIQPLTEPCVSLVQYERSHLSSPAQSQTKAEPVDRYRGLVVWRCISLKAQALGTCGVFRVLADTWEFAGGHPGTWTPYPGPLPASWDSYLHRLAPDSSANTPPSSSSDPRQEGPTSFPSARSLSTSSTGHAAFSFPHLSKCSEILAFRFFPRAHGTSYRSRFNHAGPGNPGRGNWVGCHS